jgi:LysM repeat protein
MEMEQPQQRNKSMVFVLVGSAVFLAVATFIAIILLTTRSASRNNAINNQEQLVGANTVIVNGVPILINPDLSKIIILESELGLPIGAGEPPTITPIPPTVGPTITPLPPPSPTRDNRPVIFKTYTVMQGDSLYGIAEANNSSIELMALHDIAEDHLVPGNQIQLPYANPDYCPGDIAYVVRDKDTVFRIAVQFNKTVDSIAQLNGLNPAYEIDVTQVICIPG